MSQKNAIPPLSRPPSSQTSSNPAGTVGFGNDVESGTDSTGSNATGTSNTEDGDAHSGQTTTTATAIRVHDHNRPFPPPRLPAVHVAAANSTTSTDTNSSSTLGSTGVAAPPRILLTAPLAPLSSSFRSRPSIRGPQVLESSNDSNTRGLLSSSETTSPPPSRSPVGEVSLTVPRPDGERTINEYVEAPFKHCCNQERRFDGDGKRSTDCSKIERRHRQKGISGTSEAMVAPTHRGQRHTRNQTFRGLNATAPGIGAGTGAETGTRTGTGTGTEMGTRAGSGTETGTRPGTGPGMGMGIGMGMGMGTGASTASIATNTTAANAVTKQPVSFTKEPANTLASRAYDPAGLSIMCDFCGRCRCESCREPPPLPSRWLCDNSCFCSADTILDYASCLCCVKGLFYHCVDGSTAGGMDGEAAGSCADEPCSCTGNRRVSRWACLGALTLVMPCLLCYWPFRGCVALCETCYARHAAQGCRCNPNALGNAARHHPIANDIGDSRDPEKRLLDPVTPEL